jgi:hypothetical protein
MEHSHVEGCRREIAAIEAELLAGNPDVAGLCMGWADWRVELAIIEVEQRREEPPGLNPAAGGGQLGSGQALIE